MKIFAYMLLILPKYFMTSVLGMSTAHTLANKCDDPQPDVWIDEPPSFIVAM